MESIGQRATKLPTFKVGGLKKKSASFEPVGPGSTLTGFESFSKFDGQ